jgi:hypothetical protein
MIWEELRSPLAATMDIGETTTTLSLDIELSGSGWRRRGASLSWLV